MATARGERDLEKWALMVRWTRDRDGWRELERLALLEADESRNDPRQTLERLGLVAETARQRDRPGVRPGAESPGVAGGLPSQGMTSHRRKGRVARDVS